MQEALSQLSVLIPLCGASPPWGPARWVGRRRWRLLRRCRQPKRIFLALLGKILGEKLCFFFFGNVFLKVSYTGDHWGAHPWSPFDVYLVGIPKGARRGKRADPSCFSVQQTDLFFFGGLVVGMLLFGRARHPGLVVSLS